jgi:hypothetical protein
VVVTFSLVYLLVVLVVMLIRWAGLKFWHALVAMLLGFYLASTGAAVVINQFTISILSFLARL